MAFLKGFALKYKLAFHPLVRADLVEASSWYELQLEGLGNRFEIEANVVIKKLLLYPEIHSIRVADIRRVNLPSFPYGVFHFISGETLVILAVLHGARDTEEVLARRRATFS